MNQKRSIFFWDEFVIRYANELAFVETIHTCIGNVPTLGSFHFPDGYGRAFKRCQYHSRNKDFEISFKLIKMPGRIHPVKVVWFDPTTSATKDAKTSFQLGRSAIVGDKIDVPVQMVMFKASSMKG
jgi:hypothetical protein